MRRLIIAAAAAAAVLTGPPLAAQQPADEGVRVGPASFVRFIYSAQKVEKAAVLQHTKLREQAVARRALVPDDDPQARRVLRIVQEIKPHTYKWHKRAKDWTWDTLLIKSPVINALCMPGGRIVVFTGILDQLKLTDDELAMVIGHEMAHALREHARERAAKNMLNNVSALAVGVLIGGGAGDIARMGGGLLSLSFSRGNEKEADLVGMELAARAGYNPEAALSLWDKMGKVQKISKSRWLSTHPTSEVRTAVIKLNMRRVAPLYEKAKATKPPPVPAPTPAAAPAPPMPAPVPMPATAPAPAKAN